MSEQSSVSIIESYIREKASLHNFSYKLLPNGNYLLDYSPVTGERKNHHFYISASNWLWDDKKAQKAWNWNQFRKMFGDEEMTLPESTEIQVAPKEYKTIPYENVRSYAQKLFSLEPDLLKYLIEGRQLEEKTLKFFKIWADAGKITIPIFDKNEIVVNVRKRKNPKDTNEDNPRYMSEAGCKSILFNEQAIYKRPAELYITEWEFDAMQLWQRGIVNVVSVTLWAGYFSEEWVDQMKDIKRVYICFDNDDAGIEGAKKVADKLWHDRCRIVEIPKAPGEKKVDLTDYFVQQKKTRGDFLELVKNAKAPTAFDSEAIKHISDYNDDLRKRLLEWEYSGVSTGYESLDKIMGGYRKWRVIIASGLTSVGKTTFSMNLSLSLAYRKVPIMYISMEMPPLDICRKYLMLHKKLAGEEVNDVVVGTPLMDTIDQGLKEFKWDGSSPAMPIYVFNSVWEITLQTVVDACRVAKENYGVEVLFIDHLHYFWGSSNNRASEVANIVRKIKSMALDLDLPVVLLAHLNRAGRAQQRRWLYIPTLADLKDAGAIEQDADQVMFVCRDSEAANDVEKRKTVVKLAKNRDGATWHASFDFNTRIGFFSEVAWVDYMSAMEAPTSQPKPVGSGMRKKRSTYWFSESEIDDIFN